MTHCGRIKITRRISYTHQIEHHGHGHQHDRSYPERSCGTLPDPLPREGFSLPDHKWRESSVRGDKERVHHYECTYQRGRVRVLADTSEDFIRLRPPSVAVNQE